MSPVTVDADAPTSAASGHSPYQSVRYHSAVTSPAATYTETHQSHVMR